MKRIYIVLAAVLFYINSEAQSFDPFLYGGSLLTTKSADLNGIEGSPYYEGSEFKKGELFSEGKRPLPIFLRYNVVKEMMELKTDQFSDKIYAIPLNQQVAYGLSNAFYFVNEIEYEGETIFGYFIEYYKGNEVRLLGKPIATVSEPVRAKTGYESDRPGKIQIEEEFFVVFNNGRIEKIKIREKDLKKIFDSKKADHYFSKNKIKSVEGVVEFLRAVKY